MKLEHKSIKCEFKADESKEHERNGVKVGVIVGILYTHDIDRGDDQFNKDWASKSLKRHRDENRPIRFDYNHGDLIGGFFEFEEKSDGLHVVGEISLAADFGQHIYSLAKMGALSDLSVTYSVSDYEIKDGVRIIKEGEIWAGAIVDEPMNPYAKITDVKNNGEKFTIEEVKEWSVRDLESNLSLIMSKSSAKMLAGKLKEESKEIDTKKLLDAIKAIKV